MPYSELTDALLVKLFHADLSDKEIAKTYGISVQAISKRRMKLGLARKPVARQVTEYLASRWNIYSVPGSESHHNRYSAKALKYWLRLRLGDQKLSDKQKHMAEVWAEELRARDEVLCYDPDRPEGWYYRPRTARDGRLMIDWPSDLPFPDEKFRRALELPRETATETV